VTVLENPTGSVSIPASWYPCPVDVRRLRWWDGTVWTAHTMDVAATPDAVAEAVVEVAEAEAQVAASVRDAWSPTTVRDVFSPIERKRDFEMPVYTPMGSISRPSESEMLYLLTGTSATTVWAWLLAVVPLAQAGATALIAVSLDGSTDWAPYAWVWLSLLLYPLFAHLDGRELRRRRLASVAGAWGLLPPVYLSIRAARVGRSSAGPLVTWIVLSLAWAASFALNLPA
jgi:hypothetical protein